MNSIAFHVVNSVKGGCGKSTFSLLLAHTLITNNELAYIIDLDINGSSWKMNYKDFYEKSAFEEPVYINDLMNDLDKGLEGPYIHLLNVKTESTSTQMKIPTCIIDPENLFDIDEKEIDLFENAICKIIISIYDSCRDKDKKINIVFDMPPSREKHAERILNHLLLDESSILNNKFSKTISKLNLFMLSSVTPGHIEANTTYLKKFLKNKSFSNTTDRFIKDKIFNVIFVINDVNALTLWSGVTITPKIIDDSFNAILQKSDLPNQAFYFHEFLPYLRLEYYKQQVENYTFVKTDSQYLQNLIINKETETGFEQCIKKHLF